MLVKHFGLKSKATILQNNVTHLDGVGQRMVIWKIVQLASATGVKQF